MRRGRRILVGVVNLAAVAALTVMLIVLGYNIIDQKTSAPATAPEPLRLRVPYSTATIAWTTTLQSRRKTVRKPSPVGPFFHPLGGAFVQCAHPLDA